MDIETWIMASRPKTLSAAAVPVMVGTAIAFSMGQMQVFTALVALLGAFSIQIGANFSNDLFDAQKGADTEERQGPTRVVQAGLVSTQEMTWAIIITFGVATLFGIYLVSVAGWPVILIGLASIASGVLYTGGPKPLGYMGLGDVFVFIFFGLVAVMGTTYVQTLSVPPLSFWASLPIGALATAILVVNNVRDREQDVKANKQTVVVRFGRNFGVQQYMGCLLVAYLIPVGLTLLGYGPWPLLAWASIPLAFKPLRAIRKVEGPELNDTLAKTSRLLLAYGVFFAIGLALV